MKRVFTIIVMSIFWTSAVAVQPSATGVAEIPCPATDTLPAMPDGDNHAAVADDGVRMSLDECMRYAVEHSATVAQQSYTNNNYRQDYIASIADMVPSISGTVGASTSFGRSVDPETNTYTDVSNFDNSYSLSVSVPVFSGLSRINTLRATRVMRRQGAEELQLARDQVALKTMEAYFDVVYYTESVRLAREQYETSLAEVTRTRKLLELGLKSSSDMAEVESQCASDDYLVMQQQNNLALAEIALAEAMNFPGDKRLTVDTDVAVETPAGVAFGYDEVLANALENNPKAVAAGYNERYSRLSLSVARGNLFPSIYLGGGYSTNYFMNLDNRSLYSSFSRQFSDNRGFYVSLQLNIPIFNGLSSRTNVRKARNNWHIAEQKRVETLRSLQSEVAQAYQQMLGYGKEFVYATKKTEAAQRAYEAVSGKYERGLVSAIELQTAADNLLEARSERLRARLQYIIKVRLVEYYNGEPLIRK